MYENKTILMVRELLENEFRNDYDISCENSNLKYQKSFKLAFENVMDALAELDKKISR